MGGLIVAPDVVERLTRDPARAVGFVAGCVERCAQLFTGIAGVDPARADDTRRYVELVDALWDQAAPAELFDDGLAFVDGTAEMTADDEVVESDQTAAVFALIVMRHALASRAASNVDLALQVAHACLTLAGLFRDEAGPAWYDEESRSQLDDASGIGDAAELRARYQEVSRDRLRLVQQSP